MSRVFDRAARMLGTALLAAAFAGAAQADGTAALAPPAQAARAPAGEIDAQGVARAVAGVERALRGGDLEGARAGLATLEALLPARSLTLLRMQAWVAHRTGDEVEAIARYRELLQRVPGDRNASINLALLEAGQGDIDGASRRLVALRASAGESAELAVAMAQVGAMRR